MFYCACVCTVLHLGMPSKWDSPQAKRQKSKGNWVVIRLNTRPLSFPPPPSTPTLSAYDLENNKSFFMKANLLNSTSKYHYYFEILIKVPYSHQSHWSVYKMTKVLNAYMKSLPIYALWSEPLPFAETFYIWILRNLQSELMLQLDCIFPHTGLETVNPFLVVTSCDKMVKIFEVYNHKKTFPCKTAEVYPSTGYPGNISLS